MRLCVQAQAAQPVRDVPELLPNTAARRIVEHPQRPPGS
jgi:hypothetical protein